MFVEYKIFSKQKHEFMLQNNDSAKKFESERKQNTLFIVSNVNMWPLEKRSTKL
jgi:hypothetical protein